MPQIYISQQEFEAIEYFKSIAQTVGETTSDETFDREYSQMVDCYNNFWAKFMKAKIKRKKNDQS